MVRSRAHTVHYWAQFLREWWTGARSRVNHTQDRRRRLQLVDPARDAGRITCARFPSPAPFLLLRIRARWLAV